MVSVAAEAVEQRLLFAAFTVTSSADSGAGTLRAALVSANATPGVVDTIGFSIGTGTWTIRPLTALPNITDPVIIDGAAPAAFPTQVIQLDGTSAPAGTGGLKITAGGSTIRNLTINRFSSNGIELATLGGNVIEGCKIGTDVTGVQDLGNVDDGIDINSSSNNRIGGTTAAQRNIISGNNSDGVEISAGSTGNTIVGNYIGIRSNGTNALANTGNGIRIDAATNNTVGGTTAGERNIISANGSSGVRITGIGGNANFVKGNYIGTDVNGTADLGNASAGVTILSVSNQSDTNNVIGGSATSAGNVISGNAIGIEISGSGASANRVEGNFIGTNASAAAALPNGIPLDDGTGFGIRIQSAPNNVIGGTTAGVRNVISGNQDDGVRIQDAGATGNQVQGNYIGTAPAGTGALPNGNDGVHVLSNGNTIGGTTSASRNIISGNFDDGIELQGTACTANAILGNYIGTDPSGLNPVPNQSDGIEIQGAVNNTIGGTSAGAGNVLSGNASDGVEIFADITGAATGNIIQGNLVGLNANSTSSLDNGGHGINIESGGNTNIGGTTAGAGNTIAFNTLDGISVATSTGNSIRRNSVYFNTGIGIDLAPDGVTPNDAGDPDTGSNNLQNFPVLTTATVSGGNVTINGILNSTPSATFEVELFTNPASGAQGKTYLGSTSVTTNGSGDGTFAISFASTATAGQTVTATATDATGNTSEFSSPATITTAGQVRVSNRLLFYNNSVYDGNDASANSADDGAIATNKSALLPGGTVASANVSGYSKGLNGIMMDIAGLPAGTGLSTSDFSFRTSTAGSWVAGPVPSSVTVRQVVSAGVDRITLIWLEAGVNKAVTNGWLEVTVKATANTGLSAADVFAFGNLPGDTDGNSAVTVGDLGVLATNFNKQSGMTVALGDFNGDGAVTVGDLGILSTNFNHTLAAPPSVGTLNTIEQKAASTSLLTTTSSLASAPFVKAKSAVKRNAQRIWK